MEQVGHREFLKPLGMAFEKIVSLIWVAEAVRSPAAVTMLFRSSGIQRFRAVIARMYQE